MASETVASRLRYGRDGKRRIAQGGARATKNRTRLTFEKISCTRVRFYASIRRSAILLAFFFDFGEINK